MNEALQDVSHEAPACEKFGAAVLKAEAGTAAVAGNAGGFKVGGET